MGEDMESHIRRFLEHLEIEKGYSPGTVEAYATHLYRFAQWLKENFPEIDHPEKINLEHIHQFRLYLSRLVSPEGKHLKKVTQAYYIISIRTFLRYLMVNCQMDVLSPDRIDLPKIGQRVVNFLSLDQVELLLQAPDTTNPKGLRDRAILELLFSTGLRVSELVSLNRDQVSLERKEFGVVGKGGKARVVFLSDSAANWLSRYLQTRTDNLKPLFIAVPGKGKKSKDGRLTARSVELIVDRYARQVNLPFNVTPHTLRHSFATDLMIAGADIRAVQEMLGHSSIRTTQVYTHVTDRQLREIYRAFHGRSKPRENRK
jgi:site-specific recombinase XerD